MPEDSPSLNSTRETLDRLLAERGAESSRLPELTVEKPEWWKSTSEMFDRLSDWVKGLFPSFDLPENRSPLQDLPWGKIQAVGIGLLVVTLIVLVWFLVRSILNAKRQRDLTGAQGEGVVASRAPPDALALALSRGDFAAAVRLRWRQSLERRSLPQHLTPREHLATTLLAAELAALDRAMFDPCATLAFDAYIAVDGRLAALEMGAPP